MRLQEGFKIDERCRGGELHPEEFDLESHLCIEPTQVSELGDPREKAAPISKFEMR